MNKHERYIWNRLLLQSCPGPCPLPPYSKNVSVARLTSARLLVSIFKLQTLLCMRRREGLGAHNFTGTPSTFSYFQIQFAKLCIQRKLMLLCMRMNLNFDIRTDGLICQSELKFDNGGEVKIHKRQFYPTRKQIGTQSKKEK